MGFKCFIIRLRFYHIRSCLSSSALYFIQTKALFGISRQFTFALFTVVNYLAGEFKGILWFLQNTHHRFFRHDYEHKPENALKTTAIKGLISSHLSVYDPLSSKGSWGAGFCLFETCTKYFCHCSLDENKTKPFYSY